MFKYGVATQNNTSTRQHVCVESAQNQMSPSYQMSTKKMWAKIYFNFNILKF